MPDGPSKTKAALRLFNLRPRKVLSEGQSFETAGELFAAVQALMMHKVILLAIEVLRKFTLDAVSLEWMQRLWRCIAPNGDHVQQA
jgi:hypothetical protein